jgi:hypothetical protein
MSRWHLHPILHPARKAQKPAADRRTGISKGKIPAAPASRTARWAGCHRQGNIGDGGRICGNLPQQTDASQIDFRRIVRCRSRRKRLLQPAGSRQKFENLPRGTSVIALVLFEFSKMNRYPPIQLRRKFAVGGLEKRPCKMRVLHGPGQSGIRPGRSISPKQGWNTLSPSGRIGIRRISFSETEAILHPRPNG